MILKQTFFVLKISANAFVFKFSPFSIVVVVVVVVVVALFKILLLQIFPLIWPEGWVGTFLYSKLYERGGEIGKENTTLLSNLSQKRKKSRKKFKRFL